MFQCSSKFGGIYLGGLLFLHWLGKGLAHRKLESFPYPAENHWNIGTNAVSAWFIRQILLPLSWLVPVILWNKIQIPRMRGTLFKVFRTDATHSPRARQYNWSQIAGAKKAPHGKPCGADLLSCRLSKRHWLPIWILRDRQLYHLLRVSP